MRERRRGEAPVRQKQNLLNFYNENTVVETFNDHPSPPPPRLYPKEDTESQRRETWPETAARRLGEGGGPSEMRADMHSESPIDTGRGRAGSRREWV
jgi:hypothetical protein